MANAAHGLDLGETYIADFGAFVMLHIARKLLLE